MAPASFALVCFRHRPPGLSEAALDDHNRRLLDRINGRNGAPDWHLRGSL
jgi:hypothetical protein